MQTKVHNRKMGYCGTVGIMIMSMSGINAVKTRLFDLVYPWKKAHNCNALKNV
jgi:hypothetical protein